LRELAKQRIYAARDLWDDLPGKPGRTDARHLHLRQLRGRGKRQKTRDDETCGAHGRKPPRRTYYQHESMTNSSEEISERIVELLPRLRRFARSLSRHQHDADDLVQSAVERAWKNLEQLKPGANLASWMFGIMKNAFIDDRRARGRRGEVALPEDSGEHPAVSPVDMQTSMWSVSKAMSALPEDQRLAIALVLVEGMSYKEAAEVLEIPIGTLTSRLARGRTALATALADHGGTA
jgi:RNA polymerase sigma-70 factor (ECF subfamily)